MRADPHGRAMQVDPIKPKLKPPGTKRLKLKYDIMHSSFALGFNLRRYTMDIRAMYTAVNDSLSPAEILTLRVCSVLGEITPAGRHTPHSLSNKHRYTSHERTPGRCVR